MVEQSISSWKGSLGCQKSNHREDCYRSFVEHSAIGFYRSTPDGRILMANQALVRMLGYSTFEEFTMRSLEPGGFDELHHRPGFKALMEREGGVVGLESRWKRPDGTTVWVREAAHAIVDNEGKILYLDGTVEDITSRKQAEEAVAAAWNEKVALFRELQHRIKNSLATIVGLISMEADFSEEAEVRDRLAAVCNRVRSIGNLYTLLQASGSSQMVYLDEYLERIARTLLDGHTMQGSHVTCDVTAEAIVLGTRRTIPLGLIANELITNALKHAFPMGRDGHISVTLHQDGSSVVLSVSDNGIGLPEGFDSTQSKGMGMELIQMLTAQLKGSLTSESFGSTVFRVIVPLAAEECGGPR
jgi:PAS domain S-box-containing protein